MRFNGTTIPTHRDETYDTSEVSRYKSSGGSDIEVETLVVTENGTYTAPEGKAYSPVNVDVEGGGSSDFSTAEMTLIIQNGASATITNLFLVLGQVGERYWVYREEIPFTAGTGTLPLVDGHSFFGIVPDSGVVVTVSGNAEYYSEDEVIRITGDCTITIS